VSGELDIFSANLSLDGRAKEVNNITTGHMEFSSFSAFDEWRSVLRDVEKGAYKYISTQKITKRKNVSSSLTLFV
jgi:hypothetical protein